MGFLEKIEKTDFVRKAVQEEADLGDLKQHPTIRTWFGIFLMGFSYIIGWPVISVLGYIAYRLEDPWLIAVGGPVLYGISHLVFLLGMVLAGSQYTMPFLRWAARRAVERWGRTGSREPVPPPVGKDS
jgi:hypothetical protein